MAATATTTDLLAATEQFVRQQLQGNDSSHDWSHIDRVRNMALRLGGAEGLDSHAMLVVELAALLHDIKDWKYHGSDAGLAEAIQDFLGRQQGQPASLVSQVVDVVTKVGFKDELKSSSSAADGGSSSASQLSREAAVVQDADRLDAIGAVGIARCFTFGGSRHRVLHDPSVPPRLGLTREEYTAGADQATTINHFYEKLLTLKERLKTGSGRKLAEQRHAFMESFLQQFVAEWDGRA